MATEHSPAPWRIADHLFKVSYGNQTRAVVTRAVVDANGEPILFEDPSDRKYTPAIDLDSPNARLMIEAPNLLAALEAIVKGAPEEEPEHPGITGNDDDTRDWAAAYERFLAAEIARAAIAKAKGDSE